MIAKVHERWWPGKVWGGGEKVHYHCAWLMIFHLERRQRTSKINQWECSSGTVRRAIWVAVEVRQAILDQNIQTLSQTNRRWVFFSSSASTVKVPLGKALNLPTAAVQLHLRIHRKIGCTENKCSGMKPSVNRKCNLINHSICFITSIKVKPGSGITMFMLSGFVDDWDIWSLFSFFWGIVHSSAGER